MLELKIRLRECAAVLSDRGLDAADYVYIVILALGAVMVFNAFWGLETGSIFWQQDRFKVFLREKQPLQFWSVVFICLSLGIAWLFIALGDICVPR